jgi:divalent metal cation (Fe/Co/Zn/Cd) transporter
MAISATSLGFRFWLWQAKLRTAKALDSRTREKDAACSLACIQLSAVLFAGSLAFWEMPSLWRYDAAAAILLAFLIAKEGFSSIRAARRSDFSGGCGCH